MATLSDCRTHLLMREIVFRGLRVKDERLNALVIELSGRFEKEPVRRLVLEACDRRNGLEHRLRVLWAIARIGSVTEPASFMDLNLLMADKCAEIRAEAARTIGSLRPRSRVTTGEP